MKQRILSHRGCWKQGFAKNSLAAIAHSFSQGFGIETDIRDSAGQLVISHDIPSPGCLAISDVLEAASASGGRQTLALNIKADGLCEVLRPSLRRYPQLDCFVFDMSVPDMRAYLAAGISTFTRLSDVEPTPAWLDHCNGVWLDAFASEWYGTQEVRELLGTGKRVCVVSPELHGRPHADLWRALKPWWSNDALMLCTDHPDDALHFFAN